MKLQPLSLLCSRPPDVGVDGLPDQPPLFRQERKIARKTKARLERAKLVVVAARARGRESAATCGAALNDAPSYRVAEAPLG